MRLAKNFIKNWKRFYGLLPNIEMTSVITFLIQAYQKLFSPDHGIIVFGSNKMRCRFYPSCSEYAYAVIRQYGLRRGVVASFRRILRCHPWNAGGYDPPTK